MRQETPDYTRRCWSEPQEKIIRLIFNFLDS